MKYFYWVSAIILACVLVYLFFIPAFAGSIPIPSQINLGSFAIRLYGVALGLSILVGYFIARKNSWRFGISQNEIDDFAFWLTIIAILGARIYYVIFDWGLYSSDISEIYKIWHGGLSIYGSIISGTIFILLYSRKKAYSVYQLLDLVALSMPLAQALGRFGNFFNQEAFGTQTNLPWKMYVDVVNRPSGYSQYSFFHPTFLYEGVWNVIVFAILMRILKNKANPGVLAFSYLGLYSLGRFFIEAIRLDSSILLGFKVDQLTAVALLIISGVFILSRQKVKKMV